MTLTESISLSVLPACNGNHLNHESANDPKCFSVYTSGNSSKDWYVWFWDDIKDIGRSQHMMCFFCQACFHVYDGSHREAMRGLMRSDNTSAHSSMLSYASFGRYRSRSLNYVSWRW